jgi:hypothetical protein
MVRHLPPRCRSARTRALSGVLFALLAIALATPALAPGSHKSPKKGKPPSVPNCEHFSRVKMAGLIHVGSLKFEGKSGPGVNICEWLSPHIPNHYSDLLLVDVTAESKVLFAKTKQALEKAANEKGYPVGSQGAALFYVINVVLSADAGPCEPENIVPRLGPPGCSGDPPSESVTVYSYGALKPRGPNAFVSVALAREFIYKGREVSEVIALDKEILSGQIR